MLDVLDKAVRQYSLNKNYPNRIIISEGLFEKLRTEMKERLATGLKVNLKGEPVSLFGMEIEIDKVNKDKLEICHYQSIQLNE